MIRLAVAAEGQTEAEFTKEILAEHLRPRNVEPTPVVMGGNVSIQRLAEAIAKLRRTHDAVTSLVDFYGFRGKGSTTVCALEEAVRQQVQSLVKGKWDDRRVIPYVQKYEFEALLFTAPEEFAKMDVPTDAVRSLKAVRAKFEPEDINDAAATAPSKRILQVVPSYSKVVDGPIVAAEIGLEKIRSACPRFHAWLARLEALGTMW